MTTPKTLASLRGGFAPVLAIVLLLSACGGSETDASATTSSTTPETATTTTSTTVTPAETTTTTVPLAEPVDESELPGVPFDFSPAAGSTVSVVGVAADDVLNIRRLPDAASEIIAELDPTDDAVLTARKRDLTTSIWYEVETPAGVGWANAVYLAPIGGTRDATNEFSDLLGGLPTAGSTALLVTALQQQLIANGESQEGPPASAVIIDGPRSGDLDEVIIDVLGYADDSIRGERLHVFVATEGGTAAIKSIESTFICQRGSDGAYCL